MIEKKSKMKSKATRNALVLLVIIVLSAIVVVFALPYFFPEKIAIGDCADVNYIGRFAVNGTIFESSYTDPQNMTGGDPAWIFVDPYHTHLLPEGYEQYSATKVKGFLSALIGMNAGENKTVTIPPEDAFGIWNTTLALETGIGPYPIDTVLNRTIEENKTLFTYDFAEVVLAKNTTFDYGSIIFEIDNVLNATIIDITDTNITYQLNPTNGTKFLLPLFNWNVTFLVYNTTHFSLHSDIIMNHTFSIEYVDPLHFKVVEVNETEATLAMNVGAPDISYVDQPIIYELKVVKLYKTSQQED